MANITETEIIAEKELLLLLHQYGVRLGEKAKNMWENGQISDSGARIVIMAEEIREIDIKPSLPYVTKLFAKFGTPEAGKIGNGAIVLAGVYTGGRSAINYRLTTSSGAKGCYAASVVFSAMAVGHGGVAIMAKACELSKIGVLSEALGAGFMMVGDMAHVAALQMEGKPIPENLQHVKRWKRKPLRPSVYNNQNLGFIMPGNGFGFSSETIARIPFQRIGQVVGVSLTLYGYSRVVIFAYRYGQKLITKFKEERQKNKFKKSELLKQAQFLTISIYRCPSVQRTVSIYRFACGSEMLVPTIKFH